LPQWSARGDGDYSLHDDSGGMAHHVGRRDGQGRRYHGPGIPIFVLDGGRGGLFDSLDDAMRAAERLIGFTRPPSRSADFAEPPGDS
jgi:hypothetical protein